MAAKLPHYPPHKVVNILVNKYWESIGAGKRFFALGADRTLTYNDSDLAEPHQKLVRSAFEAWSSVTGIKFKEVKGGAQIKFVDDQAPKAAWAVSYTRGNIIEKATVNIGSQFDKSKPTLDSHWFKTYIHEIGHALGVGHPGYYDGNAKWAKNASYSNDTTLFSIMSYFTPKKPGMAATETNNPNYTASHGYVVTPMMMDILAIKQLYGKAGPYNGGNTTYGHDSNVKGYMGQIFKGWIDNVDSIKKTLAGNNVQFTIYDKGGYDTFDFSVVKANQSINLKQAAFSSVGGFQNNMAIANGTLIESAIGGRGNDKITGNYVGNKLYGKDGNDSLIGNMGNDRLYGDKGNDRLEGGLGRDVLNGGAGNDILKGGLGADAFYFNTGKDVILDFQDNIDQIVIAKSALGKGIKTVNDILSHGKIVKGDAVLNLGPDKILTIENITKLSVLADDISII